MSTNHSAAALLVSELFPPTIGGSGSLLANLYKRLTDVPVTVLTDGPASQVRHGETGLPLITLPMHHRTWGLLNGESARLYFSVARAMAGASRSRRTIAYCARAFPEGLAALVARTCFNGPPYAVWTHGEELVTYSKSRELSFLLRQVHRRAAAVIANSENTKRMLEAVGVPREKIRVIYPGVDAGRFRVGDREMMRARLGCADHFVLLSVGRLQSRKGHDLAIRSMAALRQLRADIRYLIVGDGGERPRLEALAAELGVADVVRFVGNASEADLPHYYAAADVFVHPNRVDDDGDVEGFGMVFLEAAAAGLPVIGGNSGGVPEAVTNRVTGLLVGGRDVAEFVEAVRQLAESPTLRDRMGRAGQERVARQFSWNGSAGTLHALHGALQRQLWKR